MAWLVVGFGCDLAGDDGFGLSVANHVADLIANLESLEASALVAQAVALPQKLPEKLVVDVIAKRILAPELVDKIRLADGVIFVDASATLTPGIMHCTDLQSLRQANQDQETVGGGPAMVISHQCDPLTLMQLTHSLYDRSPPAWLYAVGASDFGLSEHLSAVVAAMVPQVARQIVDKIAKRESRKYEISKRMKI